MIVDILQILAGLGILYFGGEWLVRGACLLAQRLGVSPLVIGVTIVAAGTSMPELVVSLHAAIQGENDISLGNIVGSNICNIGLILGIAALLKPMDSAPVMTRIHTPIMIGVSLLLMGTMMDGTLGRLDGIILLVGIVSYTLYALWESKTHNKPDPELEVDLAPGRGKGYAALLIGAGLGLLFVGAHLLVDAAVDLATAAGVSEAFIGLTIVAVGTSLPELTTSVVAALRSQGDIAVGNIVGSNIFNILGILGLTAVIEPLAMGGITWVDQFVMLGMALLLFVLLLSAKRLGKGSGILMLGSYIGYMVWLTQGAA
jgi:cation:H+ antiporter